MAKKMATEPVMSTAAMAGLFERVRGGGASSPSVSRAARACKLVKKR